MITYTDNNDEIVGIISDDRYWLRVGHSLLYINVGRKAFLDLVILLGTGGHIE